MALIDDYDLGRDAVFVQQVEAACVQLAIGKPGPFAKRVLRGEINAPAVALHVAVGAHLGKGWVEADADPVEAAQPDAGPPNLVLVRPDDKTVLAAVKSQWESLVSAEQVGSDG